MKTAYKVVFYLSILFAVLLFLDAVSAGGKPSPQMLGVLLMSYTAWLMKKQEIKQLVSLYKGVFWVQLILLILVLAFLIPADESVKILVGRTPLDVLINGGFGLCIFGGYYLFFKKYDDYSKTPSSHSRKNIIEIEDQYWNRASNEFNDARHTATWARAFSETGGDEPKAKAIYLQIRAKYFQENSSLNETLDLDESNVIKTESVIKADAVDQAMKKNSIAGIVWVFGIICLFLYLSRGLIVGEKEDPRPLDSQVKSINESTDIRQAPVLNENSPYIDSIYNQPKSKESSEDTASLKSGESVEHNLSKTETQVAESGICYVYWDGWKFVSGKRQNNNFKHFSLSQYGVQVIDMALPSSMVKSLNMDKVEAGSITEVNSGNMFDSFLNEHIYQIEAICKK